MNITTVQTHTTKPNIFATLKKDRPAKYSVQITLDGVNRSNNPKSWGYQIVTQKHDNNIIAKYIVGGFTVWAVTSKTHVGAIKKALRKVEGGLA